MMKRQTDKITELCDDEFWKQLEEYNRYMIDDPWADGLMVDSIWLLKAIMMLRDSYE
jgi:hypothetical protein